MERTVLKLKKSFNLNRTSNRIKSNLKFQVSRVDVRVFNETLLDRKREDYNL